MTVVKTIFFSFLIAGVIFTSLMSLCFLSISFYTIIFGPDNQTTVIEAWGAGLVYLFFSLIFTAPSVYGIFSIVKLTKKRSLKHGLNIRKGVF